METDGSRRLETTRRRSGLAPACAAATCSGDSSDETPLPSRRSATSGGCRMLSPLAIRRAWRFSAARSSTRLRYQFRVICDRACACSLTVPVQPESECRAVRLDGRERHVAAEEMREPPADGEPEPVPGRVLL